MRTRDGNELTVQANRLRTDTLHAYLEVKKSGTWMSVARFAREEVDCVQRRLDEPDGRCTWITELSR
ncbi:MAG TPA: hypothetical protein VFV66_31725 [Nonomuraea sp.]|nr:hypothetical protein [Nonomuraea sp.]